MRILKYKPELFYILLTVALTECSSLQASIALDDAALKKYKSSTLYKPTNLSALTWLKDLENQRSKLDENKQQKQLKSISIEISATISGKYGISNHQATDEEAQDILSSIFKTRDYYSAYQINPFNDFYFNYNKQGVKEKLRSDENFARHVAFIFAADYIRSSGQKNNTWVNDDNRYSYQATFSYNNQLFPLQSELTNFHGNPFGYLFSQRSFTEKETKDFSDFMLNVYFSKKNISSSSDEVLLIKKTLRNNFNNVDWKHLLTLVSKIEYGVPRPFEPETPTNSYSKSLKDSKLEALQKQLEEEEKNFQGKILKLKDQKYAKEDELRRYIESLKNLLQQLATTKIKRPTEIRFAHFDPSSIPGKINITGVVDQRRNDLYKGLITEAENLCMKFHLYSLEKMGFEANYDQLNTILNKSKQLQYPGFKNTTLSGIKLSDNTLSPSQSITQPSIDLDFKSNTETKPSKESSPKAFASEKPETNKKDSRLELYQDQHTIKNITDTLNYLANLYKAKILNLEKEHKVPKRFLTPYIASFEEYVKMTMKEDADFKSISIRYPSDFDPAVGPGKLLMMNPGTGIIKPLSSALERAYQELEKEGENLAMNYRLLAIQKKGTVTDLEILDQIEKTRKITNYPGIIVTEN